MNAEVTAENRPACKRNERVHVWGTNKTHKDQGVVQVFVIFPYELSVVFFCFVAIHPVKLDSLVVQGWQQGLLLAAFWVKLRFERASLSLPICRDLDPFLFPYLSSALRISAAVGR